MDVIVYKMNKCVSISNDFKFIFSSKTFSACFILELLSLEGRCEDTHYFSLALSCCVHAHLPPLVRVRVVPLTRARLPLFIRARIPTLVLSSI